MCLFKNTLLKNDPWFWKANRIELSLWPDLILFSDVLVHKGYAQSDVHALETVWVEALPPASVAEENAVAEGGRKKSSSPLSLTRKSAHNELSKSQVWTISLLLPAFLWNEPVSNLIQFYFILGPKNVFTSLTFWVVPAVSSAFLVLWRAKPVVLKQVPYV